MISRSGFKNIVERLIMPLVAGTTLTVCRRRCSEFTVRDKPSTLLLSLDPGAANYALLLSRNQYFTEDEVALTRSILARWAEVFQQSAFKEEYAFVVAQRCLVEAIAVFIDPSCYSLILGILQYMVEWSSQSYEGRRISFSIGVDRQSAASSEVLLWDLTAEDYLKVMTSGYDTLLVCNAEARIVRHESLYEPDGRTLAMLDDETRRLYAPIKYVPLARWAGYKRYAAALNSDGELLLFKDGNLLFTRRRGEWIFLTHSAYIAGMGRGGKQLAPRKALYQTMLDVSFLRTGGCLGLWHRNQRDGNDCISEADRLDRPDNGGLSRKNRFLRMIIAGRKFHELPRKLRQELVSVDGATVILHDGTILCVGAILKVRGGNMGGGRTAAAMELARHGVGVKISNDGKITYWADIDRGPKSAPPRYEIG